MLHIKGIKIGSRVPPHRQGKAQFSKHKLLLQLKDELKIQHERKIKE